MIKKLILMIITAAIIISIAVYVKNTRKEQDASSTATVSESSVSAAESEALDPTEQQSIEQTEPETVAENPGNDALKNAQLLQSASVDLDADDLNEEVEVFVIEHMGESGNEAESLEGILRISDGKDVRSITYIKKPAGFTGVLMGMEFPDLDGDGARDVFLTIPESGASFSMSYFYAYSYKKNQSYSFTTDSSLSDFAAGFVFKYQKEGRLEIVNAAYNFKAVLDISDSSAFDSIDENNYSYENSWVEPIPVEISENSRLSLVRQQSGAVLIKVPLPIFGHGTVDMIGEVDLYYTICNNFRPELISFEVYDFSQEGHKPVGKWNKN